MKTASKTDIGQEFYVFGYGKLKFGWKKAKLAPNLHLVLTVQNTTTEELLLKEDQIIGLASKDDCFIYPTSLYRKRPVQIKHQETFVSGKPPLNFCKNDQIPRSNSQVEQHMSRQQTRFDMEMPKQQASLPFGDLFHKLNNKQASCNGDGIRFSDKPARRDPRLQRIKEKQQEKVDITREKQYFPDPDPASPSIPMIFEDRVEEKVEPKFIPTINLDLSKDNICQKTLQQVSQEMKKIAVKQTREPSGFEAKRHRTFTESLKIKENENKNFPSKMDIPKPSPSISINKRSNKKDLFNSDQKEQLFQKSKETHKSKEPDSISSNSSNDSSKKKEIFIPDHKEQLSSENKESLKRKETESVLNSLASSKFDTMLDYITNKESFKSSKATSISTEVSQNNKKITQNKTVKEFSERKVEKKLSEEKKGASCFDFLSETKPKEKSFKYLSKREELMKRNFDKTDQRKKKKKHKDHQNTKDQVELSKEETSMFGKEVDRRKKHKEKKHKKLKEKKIERQNKKIEESAEYKCSNCEEEFFILKGYKKHLKRDHNLNCSNCTMAFTTTKKLETHTKARHSDKEMVKEVPAAEKGINICSLCGDSFSSSVELTEHISSPHTSPCFHCDLMFASLDSLNKHCCQSLESQYCSTVKTDNLDLPKSISIESPSTEEVSKESLPKVKRKIVKVEALSEMATIEDAAHLIRIDHELITKAATAVKEPDKPEKGMKKRKVSQEELLCKSCGKGFDNERELFHHATVVHFENWSFGNKTIDTEVKNSSQGLNLDNGDPKGPFICNLCGESMKTWNQLLKHLWNPHSFKCEHCDKSFNRNTKLEDHVNKEHDFVGLIDFMTPQCGLCGEIFGRSTALSRHISSPHNFHCLNCDFKFQSKSLLTKHKKVCTKLKVVSIIEDCLESLKY